MTKIELPEFRCGYTAILGRPNVGKSTLLNQILEHRLSIVTPKPQTTRHNVLGIAHRKSAQIIFTDTPGLLKPKYKLHEFLLRAATYAATHADAVLFLTEAGDTRHFEDECRLLQEMLSKKTPCIVGLNKIDRINKNLMLEQIQKFSALEGVSEVVPFSALRNENIDALLDVLESYLPLSPPLFPEDQLTTAPERFFVAELLREQVFLHFGDEIPYSTTVRIDEFKERKGRKDYVRATILVERDSQKGILIGKKGAAMKRVGKQARVEIEKLLGRDIYLELFVAVRAKWRENEAMLRSLGYEHPGG